MIARMTACSSSRQARISPMTQSCRLQRHSSEDGEVRGRAHSELELPSQLLGLLARLGAGDHGLPAPGGAVAVRPQAECEFLRLGVRLARDPDGCAPLHLCLERAARPAGNTPSLARS